MFDQIGAQIHIGDFVMPTTCDYYGYDQKLMGCVGTVRGYGTHYDNLLAIEFDEAAIRDRGHTCWADETGEMVPSGCGQFIHSKDVVLVMRAVDDDEEPKSLRPVL